jgi:hypothetical protein
MVYSESRISNSFIFIFILKCDSLFLRMSSYYPNLPLPSEEAKTIKHEAMIRQLVAHHRSFLPLIHTLVPSLSVFNIITFFHQLTHLTIQPLSTESTRVPIPLSFFPSLSHLTLAFISFRDIQHLLCVQRSLSSLNLYSCDFHYSDMFWGFGWVAESSRRDELGTMIDIALERGRRWRHRATDSDRVVTQHNRRWDRLNSLSCHHCGLK